MSKKNRDIITAKIAFDKKDFLHVSEIPLLDDLVMKLIIKETEKGFEPRMELWEINDDEDNTEILLYVKNINRCYGTLSSAKSALTILLKNRFILL